MNHYINHIMAMPGARCPTTAPFFSTAPHLFRLLLDAAHPALGELIWHGMGAKGFHKEWVELSCLCRFIAVYIWIYMDL